MKVIEENWDDVLRLANTIMEGKASASLLMSKLGSYARQNSLAAALSEVGRIEKTIFILNYLEFRLFSCEARWEAGRVVFHGNRVIPVYKPLDAKLV